MEKHEIPVELRVQAGRLDACLSAPPRPRNIREMGVVLAKLLDNEREQAMNDEAYFTRTVEDSEQPPNPALKEVAESVMRARTNPGNEEQWNGSDEGEIIEPYTPTEVELTGWHESYLQMGGEMSRRVFSVLVRRFLSKRRVNPLDSWEDIVGRREAFLCWLAARPLPTRRFDSELPF